MATYNIYHDVNIKETSNSYNIIEEWDRRKEKVVEVVKSADADIIGFQEDLEHQVDYINEKLLSEYNILRRKHDYKFPNRSSKAKQAILYRKDINLVESGEFWLSKTPDEVSPTENTTTLRYLLVNYGRFRKREAEFYMFNTHFPAFGGEENVLLRQKYAELLLSRINSINKDNIPTVVTADFNSSKKRDGETLSIIMNKENVCQFRSVGGVCKKKDKNHNTLLKVYPEPAKSIYDYIFVSKGIVVKDMTTLGDNEYVSIDRKDEKGNEMRFYSSDHKLLKASLEI